MSNFGHVSREKISLVAGVDLNNVLEVGVYSVDDPTNGPAAGDWIIDVDIAVESGGTRHIVQTAKSVADGSMQVRVYNGTVWGAWAPVGGGGGVAAGDVTFTPAGSIAATDVQAALEELDAEKAFFANTPLEPYTDDHILALSDLGQIVEMNKATTVDLEIPPEASVAWTPGDRVDVVQIGAGQVTFTAGAGVTINSKDGNLALTGQYSGASLYYRGSDIWVLIGDLSA